VATIDRASPRRCRRVSLAVLLMVVASLIAWLSLRSSPEELYGRASKTISTNPSEAERLFQKAVDRAGGRFADAELQLCLLAITRGDWEATRHRGATLDWQRGRSNLLAMLGSEALAAREWNLASQAFLELRERPGPEALAALQSLVTLYQLEHQPAAALASMEELTSRAPDEPRWWWQLARAFEVREDRAAAAAVYRRALAHRLPSNDEVEMRHRLIERLIDDGDAAGAGAELARLVADGDPQFARNQVHRAHLDRMAGDFQGALADLEQVWDEIGELTDAIKLRAILQFDAGQFDAARRGLEVVVEAHPFDEVAHFKLAETCRRLGLSEEEQSHRELHQIIQAKRLEIRRLSARSDRIPPTRATCLKLAQLHSELDESERASYWIRAAGNAD
jgi:tetratricopeptide (TPR) repeat protein